MNALRIPEPLPPPDPKNRRNALPRERQGVSLMEGKKIGRKKERDLYRSLSTVSM